MAKGKWEFYCDFEKQNIFLEDVGANNCLKLLEKYGRGVLFQYRLSRNCRNTKPIASEIADIFKTGSRQVLDANLEGSPIRYLQYDGGGRGAGDISFGTIYKFKGMENSCIIIADIAGCLNRCNFEDLLYVGMSRARVGLVVLVNGEAMEKLEALKKHKFETYM
jgi:hypothetical protein